MDDDLQIDLDLDESILDRVVQPGSEVPTDTPTQPDQVQQPSTEGYIAPGEEGFVPREGALGAVQDIAEGTIRGLPKNLYEGIAPVVGVADTAVHTTANPKFAWLAGSNDSPDKLVEDPPKTPNVVIPKYLLFPPVNVNSVLSPFNEPPDGVDKKVNAEE